MKFRFRKRLRLGPLRLNFTQRGFSSYSWTLGPWSWNSRTRRHTVDTPGPGSITTSGRRRKKEATG